MLEPAFEALGPMLESEDPASSLDYLIGRFREAKDYHLMFEAMLMKKRLELDLPLIQAPNLAALPPDLQAKYQQFLVEAAQETGELLLAKGDIPKAWPYLRATGDVQRVAAAIERVEPGENVEAIIEIAFMQGVHPAKGLELVIEKFGICRALTYFGGSGGEKDRSQCIGVLARSIYSELAASLDNAIEEREGHIHLDAGHDDALSGLELSDRGERALPVARRLLLGGRHREAKLDQLRLQFRDIGTGEADGEVASLKVHRSVSFQCSRRHPARRRNPIWRQGQRMAPAPAAVIAAAAASTD